MITIVLLIVSSVASLTVAVNALGRRGGLTGMRLALWICSAGGSLTALALLACSFAETPEHAIRALAVVRAGAGVIGAGISSVGLTLAGGRWAKWTERLSIPIAVVLALVGTFLALSLTPELVVRTTTSWYPVAQRLRLFDSAMLGGGGIILCAGAITSLLQPPSHGRRAVWTVLVVQLSACGCYVLMRWLAPLDVLQLWSPVLISVPSVAYWFVLEAWRVAGVSHRALWLSYQRMAQPAVLFDLRTDSAVPNPAASAIFGEQATAREILEAIGLQLPEEISRDGIRLSCVPGSVFDLHFTLERRRGIGLLVLSDVTERVARTNMLEAALEELRDMHERLTIQEKMAALGVLVAGVNHEINNPLAYVTSNLQSLKEYLEILARGPELARQAASAECTALARLVTWAADSEVIDALEDGPMAADEALQGCRQIRETVSSMRLLSRRNDVEQSLDLSELARAGVKIGRTNLSPDVVVEVALEEPLPVRGEGSELTRVVTNLVVNAGQALGRSGRIRVRSFVDLNDAVVEVADDGPGISPELRSRIFEPFFTTKAPGEGTGLGLAISYETLRRHRGLLELVPSEQGACFRMRVPLIDVEEITDPGLKAIALARDDDRCEKPARST